MQDLNRAIELLTIGVNATPQDNPQRAVWLNNLGTWLKKRYDQTNSDTDLDCALRSYLDSWDMIVAQPSNRIESAKNAAGILAIWLRWEQASILLEEAVKLLPTVSLRLLKDIDKQSRLSNFAGLASMAAATALNAGKEAFHALQTLELGRGVIAGLLVEMRSDISDLQQHHPENGIRVYGLSQGVGLQPIVAAFSRS